MTALVLRPAAVTDLEVIRGYYDGVQGSLDVLFARLEEFPRSAPRVAGYTDVRRAVLRGFPYLVFYRHEPDRIVVLRVLHAARAGADRPTGETPR